MKTRLFVSTLGVAIIISLIVAAQPQAGRVHPALEAKLQEAAAGEKLAVIVELAEQARPYEIVSAIQAASRREKARAVVQALRATAEIHQGPMKTFLRAEEKSGAAERVIPLWIFNGIAVTATEPLIRSLAARPDVREVRLDRRIPLPSLSAARASGAALASEWNIEAIRAPEVWAIDPAYNGQGAVVGSFDTGVDLSHPDLLPRFRGGLQASWFDPYGEHSFPYDFHGHGTHTTGTAVGGDASGSAIGVAPGAVWIAAKGWNDAGVGLASAFHQIFEWFLAPGGNPDNAPDVVNNSWGFEDSGCDTEFVADIEAWRAAGIFPSFSVGNDGPSAGSARAPGAYPISFAVGATGPEDEIAYFSARGPSPCDGGIKPDICAPGDWILSALPGGYDVLSGSSMAAPHVSGAVAVLRSINHDLTVDQLESVLMSGAKDLSAPGLDNASGAGRLDLFISAQVALRGLDVPVVKAVAGDALATEAGQTSGSFTVSRTGNTDAGLDVRITITGSATAGSDYEAVAEVVTIPAGAETASVLIIPIDDPLTERDETIILTIDSDTAYIVSASDTATITLQSDELISDLLVSGLTVPATAGAGQGITITETTKNQGAGAAEASLTRFHLSLDTALDAGDALLGGRSIPALPAGATSSASTALTIPEGTSTGNWYLIAKADVEDVVIEASETNNTNARMIKVGPDLDVTDLTAPATAGPGQTIAATDTIKNQGGGAAAPSRTRLYLSQNTALDAGDTLLGGRDVPALAAGATNSGSATVTIPEGTATGNWYLLAQADGEGVVVETSETNNIFVEPIKIGPDLDITALSAPAASGAGETIAITDTTTNAGGGAAGPSRTRFYLSLDSSLGASDILLGGRDVPALAAGAASSGSATVTIPEGTAAGSWNLIAKADGEEAVTETSETNNTSSRVIKIGPDLDITALSVPAASGAGETITITDTTTNSGGGAAGPTRTRFYLSLNSALDASDILLGDRAVPALPAGAASSGSTNLTIPEGTATGNWNIIAKADGEEVVTETSETNNIYARAIKIGPDLDVTALAAPATAGAGQTIAATETTKNSGGGAAGPSRTQFYLSLNSTVDASDVLLGGRSVPALAAGAASSATTSLSIPEGTAAGSWYLIAKADGEEAVAETTETNNIYPFSVKIGPDLDLTAFSAPATTGPGRTITLTESTKNAGGGAAGPTRTQFYLSLNTTLDTGDALLGGRSIPALAAGTASSGSTAVNVPEGTATGTWYLIAKADGEEAVAETSETNNTAVATVKIGPDLDITAFTVPAVSGAGESITVNDTTTNAGGGAAGPTRTQFYLSLNAGLDASDILLGGRSVPALSAGAASSGPTTLAIPAGTATGTWNIIAKADGEDAVGETTETNNTYLRSVNIGPDLDVTTVSAPTSAGPGQTIAVTDTVKNAGGGAAGPTRTQFYLSLNSTLDASDILLGGRSVPALAAGASHSGSASVVVPQGTALGNWYIIARADGEGVVAETSESNNNLAKLIAIK